MKLTETQLLLLSKASQRDDRAIEVSTKLKGGPAQKIVGKLLTEGLVEEIPADSGLPVSRQDDEQGALALRVTKAGLQAIRVEDAAHSDEKNAGARGSDAPASAGKSAAARRRPKRKGKPAAKQRPAGGHGQSKQARVIAMLSAPDGTTVAAIIKATGWQPHSVRGFFAAVVRKKFGLKLESHETDRGRVYRIGGKPKVRAGRSGRRVG